MGNLTWGRQFLLLGVENILSSEEQVLGGDRMRMIIRKKKMEDAAEQTGKVFEWIHTELETVSRLGHGTDHPEKNP